MIVQDDIFALFDKMTRGSSFARTGYSNIEEWAELFPEEEVIETIIAMEGSSQANWDYGHWSIYSDHLISTFGEKLRPYLESRIRNPLHGGGTAMGNEYLERSKANVQRFCQQTLLKLNKVIE